MNERDFLPLRVLVLTISDTRTLETDRSGEWVACELERAGHQLVDRQIVKDEILAIRGALEGHIARASTDVIITTGGTGITARDVTPEAIEPLITKAIPGFGELFRWLSFADVGASTIQSRALAGLCGGMLVFALPGSTGAVRLAMEKIIVPQLDRRTRPCNFAELLPRIRGAG